MKNIIIGTAGHIDHGKTTLIRALTGRETDRWEEEKKRGITIDLGFTYFDLPNGDRAGIIDVPGHERFIKNMLAGVIGMDLVMLVIAADEGIMPQTKEHINILNQLGVKKGIVVLNKADLVDEEWMELVKDDIKEELKGTFFEQAEFVEVSAVTKMGIENLTNIICKLADTEVEERDVNTIPRLPIDRAFTISGFGTVITGTLITGKLKKGDEVEIFPINKTSKVRNIQVHGKDAEYAYAGQRAAVNLAGLKKSELYRGCVIAPVNSMKNTMMIDVRLDLLKDSKRIVENRSRLHLYTGTSEILCRVVLLDKDQLSPGEGCYAQLRLEEEIAVRRGDKFIVRFYSPMETIGGGEIIEPVPTKEKRFDDKLLEELKIKEKGSHTDVIEKIIKENSKLIPSVGEVAKITALTDDEIKANMSILEEEEKITVFRLKNDTYMWHKDYERTFETQLDNFLNRYHSDNKYKKGAKKAEIKSRYFSKIKQPVFDIVMQTLADKGEFKQDNEYIAQIYFEIQKDADYLNAEEKIMRAVNSVGFDFLKVTDVMDIKTGNIKPEDIVALMIDDKKLIKVNEECIISSELYSKAKEMLIEFIKSNGKITAAEYRDILSTNRKNAILLLEHFDLARITKRSGNDRVIF